MRIPRIFVEHALHVGAQIELPAEAANHCLRVLRLKEGAELVLFNGQGGEYAARLAAAGKREARVEVVAFSPREAESPLQITLAQGISKGERMDYTLQKSVELGVARIIPLETERTVVNLRDERADKRVLHWQGVVRSACEQCGRNRLPSIEPIQGYAEWLGAVPAGLKLVLHHRADQGPRALQPDDRGLTLLIGPEGGLSEAEIEQAIAAGFTPVCLGPRVLRTETAAVAAIAALQALWGDLGGA